MQIWLPMKYKRYLTEFIATFCMVLCGTGAVVVNQETHGAIGHAGVAAVFGLVVMAMIYSFGHTSGAHINPAVSIAFTIDGTFSKKQLPGYLLAQTAGALAASGFLKILFPSNKTLGATLPAGSDGQSFILEVFLSFMLMLVILKTSRAAKETGTNAALAIGAVVALEALFAGPISGASMNPARSIGPAVVSGQIQHLWIYLTAPLAGCIAAVVVNRIL